MKQTSIPPTAAVMEAVAGTEREILSTFLDFHRGVVVRKVRGVGASEARQRRVPSLTTLAGLVLHLTVAEQNWFHRILAQRTIELPGESTGDADGSWRLDEATAVEDLISGYENACAVSRGIAGVLSLDHLVPHPWLGEVSLRWIYVHMIEETARHAGHADILRELTDGETGAIG